LLVVDDQDDVRILLLTALEMEGYEVIGARNARDGLRCLEDHHFHLVVTDYAMPGETGLWMLHEAARRHLLDGTPALVVTAHPDVRADEQDFEVVRKPLDLDRFLAQVRSLLGTDDTHRGPADGLAPDGSLVVELVLYVSSASLASLQAQRNLKQALRGFDRHRFRLTICDLSREPFAGEADSIVVTPTLVKRFPGPRMWIIGSLEDRQVLADVLEGAGLEERL